ncbi:MAG: hypothetical protein V5A55_13510 [Halovenus sp.]
MAGPLLALGVNSPFLPPALYDNTEPDRDLLLERDHAEKRIPVYEGMMNPVDGPPKVGFPGEVTSPAEAVDRIAADWTLVPAEIEAGQRFDDAFVHLRHKHGSYWRWVRPVFDGATAGSANVRIEFRPLPAQPTLPDTLAFVAAFAGLLTAFHDRDHPARELAWDRARENFRAAARDGIGADLVWLTADGDRTGDPDRIVQDLLDTAVDGLERQGLPTEQATAWIAPLVGLLGLYPVLADRSPRLVQAGLVFAVILMLVPSPIFVTNFLILPAILGPGPNPPEVGFVITGLLTLAMLAVGYVLRTVDAPTDRAEPVSEPATE